MIRLIENDRTVKGTLGHGLGVVKLLLVLSQHGFEVVEHLGGGKEGKRGLDHKRESKKRIRVDGVDRLENSPMACDLLCVTFCGPVFQGRAFSDFLPISLRFFPFHSDSFDRWRYLIILYRCSKNSFHSDASSWRSSKTNSLASPFPGIGCAAMTSFSIIQTRSFSCLKTLY